MDFLILCTVIVTCVALAAALPLLQKILREQQEGKRELTAFFKCGVFPCVLLAFLVFLIVASVVFGFLERLMPEMGIYHTRSIKIACLVSLPIAFAMCYSIWLMGWHVGRTEGLRTAEKLRRDADSAIH